ncbi:DUF362 domain-containing protein [Candidatus Latescibacterota bacterium]
MKRRTFLQTTAAAAITASWTGNAFAQAKNNRDITYEPDRPLESQGLRISDVLKILKKGENGNIPPALREEILDNPNAVFIIYAGIKTERDENGRIKPCPEQIKRFGYRSSQLIFRKSTDEKGRTYIKPNLVGSLSESRSVEYSHGGIVHPYFITGFADGLRGIGNSNLAIGARGALRHPDIVASGFQELLDEHNIPLIEAHEQYFKDYKRSELVWHENPEGIITRKFCSYKPTFEKNTTFVNLAHAHVHPFGHTTLTLKNLQGIMPRGYGHTCDAWPTLDIWRRQFMDDFNPDFRTNIEKSYIRHGNEGYKHWDHGGFYKQYVSGGGFSAFKQARDTYETKRGEERTKALDGIYDIADSRLFLAEQWAQRMMDQVQAFPQPYVSMVDGIFSNGHDNGAVHSDYLTVGRSMVAVDAVTTWLMGHDPREVPYLRIANERGLGNNDIASIPIYLLDESGVKKIGDYRDLKRSRCGITIYRLSDLGVQYF